MEQFSGRFDGRINVPRLHGFATPGAPNPHSSVLIDYGRRGSCSTTNLHFPSAVLLAAQFLSRSRWSPHSLW